MEMFLFLAALLLVAIAVTVVHRRHQVVTWNRELDQAFGGTGPREISHRRL